MLTAFFLTAAAGRVGVAMTGLAWLVLVQHRTGSFTAAGALGAGLALAEALVGPQTARAVDRFGQPRVLPVLATLHALAVAVALATAGPGAPAAALLAPGCLLGATVPQLGAFSAARWSSRHPPGSELSRAFGWEASANSLAYLLGPVLVGAGAGAGRPALAVLLAGTLVVSATALLGAQRASAPPAHRPPSRGHRPPSRGLPRGAGLPIAVNVAVGVHFGAVPLAVTATVLAAGRPGASAWLFAASSGGGLLAGLGLAAARWRAPVPRQLRLTASAFGLAALLLLVPWPLPALAPVLFVVGATVPPVLVTSSVLARDRAPAGRLTATFAWLASCSAGGSAAATAVGGGLVDAGGAGAAFALATAGAVGVGVLGRTAR